MRKNLSFTLATGFIGAAFLIITFRWFVRGPGFFYAYGAYFLFLGLMLWKENAETFGERFKLALYAFLIAGLSHYLYLAIDRHVVTVISLFGHLWRIAMLVGGGLPFCAAVAVLSGRGRGGVLSESHV